MPVSRKAIEKDSKDYLEKVNSLGGGGHQIPPKAYERALKETMQAKERIIRARGDKVIDMATKTRIAVEHEVIQSVNTLDEWRVEGIDYDRDSQVYVAIFSGPQAKERAEEYAAFKNRGV